MKLQLRYKGGKGSGFRGHSGRPGEVGGSSVVNLASSFIGAKPAKDVVNYAPKNIQEIIDKSYFHKINPFKMQGVDVAGTEARKQGDGSYLIAVTRDSPSPGIIIHEATHAFQSNMQSEIGLDKMLHREDEFRRAATDDNNAGGTEWGSGYIGEYGNGREVWAIAAQSYYTYYTSAEHIIRHSPKVVELLIKYHGKSKFDTR